MRRDRLKSWYFLTALLIVGAVLFFRPSQVFRRTPPDWNASNPLDQIGKPKPETAAAPDQEPRALSPAPKDSPRRSALPAKEVERLRSEAKISLAANYAAQRSFYAEYKRYTTDLNAVGWLPNSFPLPYKAGFLQPFNPQNLPESEDPRLLDTDAIFTSGQRPPPTGPLYTPSAEAISLSSLSGHCKMGCTANERSFEMLVAFNLDEDATLEVWRITDKKELEQLVDDLKN